MIKYIQLKKAEFLPAMILILGLSAQNSIKIIDTFSSDNENMPLAAWEEKSFLGYTQYTVQQEEDNAVLHAFAGSAASGLIHEIKYDVKDWPYLSWRWKVVQIPEKGDVQLKETDDYGARVYVVFPRFLKWKTKTITYIWANRLSKGEVVPNAWLPDHVQMIALQSSSDSLGVWVTEKVNVYKDYIRLFGAEPPKAGAIALMSDGDNTGGIAEAYYDDFILSKE
ncbi:DUF3047 domain-containing protein [candidate division KSB1 bacterium]|nr:DUF3047 domain-containing protein [candidate division KSB1 bacterium]